MKKHLFLFSLIGLLLLPSISSAHSFGKLYNLPVPFWMYLYGGVIAMLASFLIIGYFFKKKSEKISYPTKYLYKLNFLTNNKFLGVLRIISISLFVLTVITGLIGEDSSYSNFNMNFFWIIFVLGLTYLTAIIGNVFANINPWKILTDWLVGTQEEPLVKYPVKLGYYPALVFYFFFIWFELVGQTTPFKLSVILLVYTIISDLGVITFGREIWFRYCEFFSVFFRLIGKIAPFEYRDGKLHLRPPFIGLLKEDAEHFSLVLFVLFMLSSTAFDGFKETVYWTRFYWRYLDELIRPVFGTSSYPVFTTVGLLLSPFVFLIIYLFLIYLSKKIARNNLSLKELSLKFAFSLIPIAFVYNVAHYYTLIFSEGPNIIRLASDPFGWGWNLLNTASSYKSIIVGANFAWHSQVALILVGHIVSVYLTHIVALNTFASTSTKRAFLSQFPMLVLMIVYTVVGLWILSQPITGGTI